MKKYFLSITLLVSVFFCLTSCQKEKTLNSNAKKFNLEKFSQGLRNQIALSSPQKNPEGYSFVITQDGLIADSVSYGNALRNFAAGNVKWTTNQEINVASVTKTLTAVAAFQLLKKNDLSELSTISKWLPKYLKANPAFQNIKFKELMTHTSGIIESATDYPSMRQIIGKPLSDPTKTPTYSNVNFALFRIMIPFLVDSNTAKTKEAQFLPQDTIGYENWLSATYINYMQQNVFTPAGLGTVNCKPSANTAMAFSEPSGPGQASANVGDWTETCGGGGFFMSVQEMSKWIVYLTHTTNLLSSDQRKMMDSQLMGWDDSDSPMTYAGKAFGKDGALRWDSNNNGIAPDQGDAGLQTLIMKFPNKVELALAINSLPGSWRKTLSSMAATAYDAAWE